MLRDATGYEVFPLVAGGNDNPTLAAGSATNWDLSAIPISIGHMAYYVLGLVLTLYGTVTQSGGTGVVIQPDALTGALLQSIELRNCWHGTPISQAFALGNYLPLMEYLGCGNRLPRRESLPIPTTNGATNFARTIVVPLCIGMTKKPHHTAQLAAMFKKAQFVLNVASAATLTALSPGATFSNLNARCSIILDPHQSLLLAPGTSWVDYQAPANGTQAQVLLNSFGNASTLVGTNKNDGVLALYAIGNGSTSQSTGMVPLPGSFDPAAVSTYEFPWRSQFRTNHPEALAAAQFLAMGGNSKQAWAGDSTTFTAYDSQGFPYMNGVTTPVTAPAANKKPILAGMYGYPLVVPTEDLLLPNVQTAQANESYFLSLSTGSFAGTHHTLAWHVSDWQGPKVNDWINTVIAAGLARTVLGTDTPAIAKQRIGTRKQSRFLPTYLTNPARQ
jgi:hypothetical protein